VQLGEDKMSKSLGNLVTIKEALVKYGADAIRLFILNSHYRSPLTYSEEGLEAAEKGVERLLRAVSRDDPGGGEAFDAESYRKQFVEAMDDDFNTAKALGSLFELANAINQAGDAGVSIGKAQGTLTSLAREVLGLKLPRTFNVEVSDGILLRAISEIEIEVDIKKTIEISAAEAKSWQFDTRKPTIGDLIELRQQFRKDKKWSLADEIRLSLDKKGIILEDTPKGTVCKRKR